MLAFHRPSVIEKIKFIEDDLALLAHSAGFAVPDLPARDILVLPPQSHPQKKGLSKIEGQGRLLHDLASIELQAMELGLRTLNEFPQAPAEFLKELSEVTRGESKHLQLCLEGLSKLGFKWGHWPVHCSLWAATAKNDSLLDRILIVHRYLEGSGLDAGEQILKRLKSIQAPRVQQILTLITEEEVAHVEFGSRWYKSICLLEGLDPEKDFSERMWKIRKTIPRRIEKLSYELRKRAGFSDGELRVCEDLRAHFLSI